MILDSHLAWTPEFEIELSDGSRGRGSTPRGETVSIFEDASRETGRDVVRLASGEFAGRTFDQAGFDAALLKIGGRLGGRACMALSIAFYEAVRASHPPHPGQLPTRLLLNILNAGLHAYTNPVVGDIAEIMLFARSADLTGVADQYIALLDSIRSRLRDSPTTVVGGNRVHFLGNPPDEASLRFLRAVLRAEGLESEFGIAVDASAGDWWTEYGYQLPVSGRQATSRQMQDWWLRVAEEFELELLEDPLAERDIEGWSALHQGLPLKTKLLGDNLTSTSLNRLQEVGQHVDGVLVKPNQVGTISTAAAFAREARAAGKIVIASHRSIETESTFIVHLASDVQADGLKIGPFRDFSAVLKFNEMVRIERSN